MVKNVDYNKMNLDELEKEKQALDAQGEKIREQRRLIDKVIQSKAGEAKLRSEIASKSEADKAKMKEILNEG